MPDTNKYFLRFKKLLEAQNITVSLNGEELICSSADKSISFSIPFDLLATAPAKLAATVQSRLSLNKKVFARNSTVQKIDRVQAESFLDNYHLMNSTTSAFNYGLFLKDELMAVASFSKGRKMDRLPGDKRSFELIRFCCREGITVTGGLTKLLKHFCREKKAGDIMTYIDKQFSSGQSFIKAGFVKHSETAPHFSLVDKKTFQRTPVKNPEALYDKKLFYLLKNKGNIKLIYTCVN
ncbi:MAG: hypothetical protein H0W61_11960 [Bacteroidetes bacterium]|nr:hypothetical protein [Bacteroidota bacterium]